MKGKKDFTESEIEEITELINKKLTASTEEQKKLRNKIRDLGFYASDFGLRDGYDADDFLSKINKVEIENKIILSKIEEYKKLISNSIPGILYNEIYKWETIQHFQDNWSDDQNPNTILDYLKKSFNKPNNNLWSGAHYFPYAVILEFAVAFPKEVSEMFKTLYNESISLNSRLDFFLEKSEELRKLYYSDKNLKDYQSDRAIMLYLTLRYPKKYYLYKNSMFNDFCEITKFKEKPGRAKQEGYQIIADYITMCNQVREILVKDEKLLQINKTILPNTIHFEDNYHTLTQDFIYSVTTYLNQNTAKPYTEKEMVELFKAYLTKVIPNSVRNYLSAIPTISRIAKEANLVESTIYEIQVDSDLEEFMNDLENQEEYRERNKVGKNMFSAAMMHYNNFLKELNKNGSMVIDNLSEITYPLNQILFGPPGTGKTYNSINKALEIIGENIKGFSRERVNSLFQEKLNDGQIVFTTFHQSMSYEDFVEGIKPQKLEEGENLKYYIEPGIFKAMCDKAKTIKLLGNKIDWDKPDYYKMSLGGKNRTDVREWCYENDVITIGWGGDKDLSEFTKITTWAEYRDDFYEKYPELIAESRFSVQAVYAFQNMQINDIVVISKGNHIVDAIGVVKGTYFWDDSNPIGFVHFRKVEWIATELNISPDRFFRKNISQMSIYQFTPSDIKKEAFKEITAPNEIPPEKKYVVIIDEINRGNVSQIFGELITLIEEDKRLGKGEELQVMLPYSKAKFGVPANVYILGTMNTADRSVEALDTALRRRFSFIEIAPDYDLDELKTEIFGYPLNKIIQKINQRLEKLLNKDSLIGHSYFLSVKTEEQLKEVFQYKIIPLLQEYFYGDIGKIGLVLGKGFIQESIMHSDKNLFAEFEDYDVSGLLERKIYHLNNYCDDSPFNNDSFMEAIKTLMI